MIARVVWTPCYRLIAARLPRITIFERIANPDDLPAILELEALTNPRLREALGPLQRIPTADRVAGPGAAYIMAAFAYPSNGRFSHTDGGAYYASRDLDTSVAEVSFHRARFAERTATPPMDFDERIVEADLAGDLEDLTSLSSSHPVLDPDPASYSVSQAFGRTLRARSVEGVRYRSVRREGGECVAAFVPRILSDARTAGYVGLRWDGRAIVDAYRKESLFGTYPDPAEGT